MALLARGRRAADAVVSWLERYANFYRVHMTYFVVVGIVCAAILYASSPADEYVPFIDCMFLSYSAITVTGLTTHAVSQLTVWQQVLLVIEMMFGNLIIVSITIVLVRRRWFAKAFREELQRSETMRERVREFERRQHHEHRHTRWPWHRHGDDDDDATPTPEHDVPLKDMKTRAARAAKPAKPIKIHAGMIHRIDEPAVHVNPTGHQTRMVHMPEREDTTSVQGAMRASAAKLRQQQQDTPNRPSLVPGHVGENSILVSDEQPTPEHGIRIQTPDMPMRLTEEPEEMAQDSPGTTPDAAAAPPATTRSDMPPRRTTFRDWEPTRDDDADGDDDGASHRRRRSGLHRAPAAALHRSMTKNIDSGLGQFPSVLDLVTSLLEMTRIKRRLEVPTLRTVRTMQTKAPDDDDTGGKLVPYLTFDALVSGNSHFNDLTAEERSELGGVEYRALNLLAWLLPTYWVVWVLLAITITAPYLASDAGAGYVRAMQDQPKPPANSTWFWSFSVVSAFTNNGMALTDSSLAMPLARSYMILFPLMLLIVVGNTGFPVMLRFVIWVLSRCAPKTSRMYETLKFLLDHPRRCYLYLFPSYNTWFLFAVVLSLTLLDWLLILVCDLELRHSFDTLGSWVTSALFQAVAVRMAGLQTFSLNLLAPAEQLFQVFMMYIAAYPVMMVVRSTNVYEDASVAVADSEPNDIESDSIMENGQVVWGRFLSRHIRHQLEYDIGWLAVALWMICMIERTKIQDSSHTAMSIFSILYEVVSAYGTVGLSLGSSTRPTSLAGDFSVVSKLIMIAIMVRGRHRGLPSAIDRAVMLPKRAQHQDEALNQLRSMTMRSNTMGARSASIQLRSDTMSLRRNSIHRAATMGPSPASPPHSPRLLSRQRSSSRHDLSLRHVPTIVPDDR